MRGHHNRRRAAAAATALLVAGLAVGCGGDDSETGSDPDRSTAEESVPEAGDVPEECAGPFPQAFGTPDLSELALLPEDFPEPPVEAVLCMTAETVGGQHETASYATPATAEEILTGYEQALSSWGGARGTDGTGAEIVTADTGGLAVQVTPRDGGFVVALSAG